MVRLLRVLLGLALVSFIALLGVVGYEALRPPPPVEEGQFNDPPQSSGLFLLALATPIVLAPSLTLLAALRGRRPRWAWAGLIATSVALAVVSAAVWIDLRKGLECNEMRSFSPLLLPAWLGLVVILASSRAGREALGLGGSRAVMVLHALTVLALVALATGDALCLACARRPYVSELERLEAGASWGDVLRRLESTCWVHTDAVEHRMEAECRPSGPPVCRCAPTWTSRARLTFDESGKLQSWRRWPGLGGLDSGTRRRR